jgi:hypothetical protein
MDTQPLFELTLDPKVLADFRLAAPDHRRVESAHLGGDLVIIVWPATINCAAAVTGELPAIIAWLIKITSAPMALAIIGRAQHENLIKEV